MIDFIQVSIRTLTIKMLLHCIPHQGGQLACGKVQTSNPIVVLITYYRVLAIRRHIKAAWIVQVCTKRIGAVSIATRSRARKDYDDLGRYLNAPDLMTASIGDIEVFRGRVFRVDHIVWIVEASVGARGIQQARCRTSKGGHQSRCNGYPSDPMVAGICNVGVGPGRVNRYTSRVVKLRIGPNTVPKSRRTTTCQHTRHAPWNRDI
mmetsp:Transcript_28646/g.66826  ORF Transcript_28646/g.66826 Transcript_28646/m.66826 type:complete len:206 (-) Transcript_28646:20-637(-)